MTPFQKSLKARILGHGPIPLETVMEGSNAHYYGNKIVFGAQGDFITSPEISQVFGEILACWVLYHAQKKAQDVPHIVEFGPGRGSLMRDMVRVFNAVDFSPKIHLIETSERLRLLQKQALPDIDMTFYDDLKTLPSAYSFFIANEFFDALPLQQEIDNNKIHVTLSEDEKNFAFTPLLPAEISLNNARVKEYSPAARTIAHTLATRLKTHGGRAVILDYGDYTPQNKRYGDTFQGVFKHRYVDPLLHLGEADLTAHVDFCTLADIFLREGLQCNFMTQGEFLVAHGFLERVQTLLSHTQDLGERKDVESRAHRLINHAHMGTLFKVLEIYGEV